MGTTRRAGWVVRQIRDQLVAQVAAGELPALLDGDRALDRGERVLDGLIESGRHWSCSSGWVANARRCVRGQGSRSSSGKARLDACRYGNRMAAMARAATTSDVFNAIAEP